MRRIMHVARTTTPFDDLLDEMAAKGRAEGKAVGRAKALHRLLQMRFGTPGSEITQRVVAERDIRRLDHWLDLAGRAESLAEFACSLEVPR